MDKKVIYVGLDVDDTQYHDTQYHGSALNKDTDEVISGLFALQMSQNPFA